MIDTILFEWDRLCKRNLHVATEPRFKKSV